MSNNDHIEEIEDPILTDNHSVTVQNSPFYNSINIKENRYTNQHLLNRFPKKITLFQKVEAIIIIFMIISVAYYVKVVIDETIKNEEWKNQHSSPGEFNKDYLGNDYSNILVEFDYIRGYDPDGEAIDHLRTILERECNKEVIIDIDDIIQTQDDNYTYRELNNMEKKYRDHYRKGNTAVIYFLYLNGEFHEDTSVLGISHHGSSVAIFIEQAQDAATLQISEMEIERALLVHETGHLLGLVEINYKSDHDHNDEEHEHHCTHTNRFRHHDCIMFWAIESRDYTSYDSYYNQIVGDLPNDFCEYCRADLQKLREMA